MRRSRQLPGERALKDGGQAPVSFGELVRGWLAGKGQDPRREHLEQLWRNWSMVMGPEIAALAVLSATGRAVCWWEGRITSPFRS